MRILFVLLLWLPLAAFGAIGVYDFDNREQEERFRALAAEMSCPKCQNQSIIESDADIAADMRRRVARMIREGHSNEEIIDHFRQRYGDFIHYRPPVGANTIILWAGPIGVLVAGALLILVLVRRAASAPLDDDPDPDDARDTGGQG